MYRGGVTLVIIGEVLVFVTLFSTRFLLAGMERLVEPRSAIGLVISAALVVSLIPAWLARSRIAAGDAKGMAGHLFAAAALAAIALIAMVYDWANLPFTAGSPFGENYVISTGIHAVHVLIGGFWLFAAATAVCAVLAVWFWIRARRADADSREPEAHLKSES